MDEATQHLVQMHLHTSEVSRCGRSCGRDMARACFEAGYETIVMTDHFFTGNCACPRQLPWHEKVQFLMRGYREARAEGEKLGLVVLPGWEYAEEGREILTYGLDERFLLAYDDLETCGAAEYVRRALQWGGFLSVAHPFRSAAYVTDFVLKTYECEALEVHNASHRDPICDELAIQYAIKNDMIGTAGSDAHGVEDVGKGAMVFFRPITSQDELVSALRARQFKIMYQPIQ